jgi:hypothetical protein
LPKSADGKGYGLRVQQNQSEIGIEMKTVSNQFCVVEEGGSVTLLIDGVTSCISDEKVYGTVSIAIPLLDAIRLGHALIDTATVKAD